MCENKAVRIDNFDPNSRSQITCYNPLLSSQDLGWKKVKFEYFQTDGIELSPHFLENHGIVISYIPICFERKLDGVFKREKTNSGSVLIIPKGVEHWTARKNKFNFSYFTIIPDVLAEIALETINLNRVELILTFLNRNQII